ncbi:MAG: glucuronate isomerase [Clostridiales bacterium]|nr:glucuronate isomerase [Clostridiales bacterium]
MKEFMDDNFLLESDIAELLYHNYAKDMPIIDYHCHVSPAEIADDHKYKNITEVWLGGDHYKWRAMRSCGFPERVITGNATDYEKFEAFCAAMPNLIGNPLYHWSHLELKRYFGYDGIIRPENCREIWDLTEQKLSEPDLSVRGIIKKSNVSLICTTDDPADSLDNHAKIHEDESMQTKVLPAFRPDNALRIQKSTFRSYIEKLSAVAGVKINDFVTLCDVLSARITFFNAMGCRTADHAMDDYILFDSDMPASQAVSLADVSFKRAMEGGEVPDDMALAYRSALIRVLAHEYAKVGWVMQIHLGVIRNTSSVMFGKLGADTGFDTIGSFSLKSLAGMLDTLDKEGSLPKTVLYSINPTDNAALGTLIGCFQRTSDEAEGLNNVMKIQHGSAWWFNDNKNGMTAQLENLANLSALGKFIGVLTDSRSFLSYTRHEYFRRILCNVIGGFVQRGEYPLDIETLAQMVCDISYNNAKDYFGFKII